MMSVDISVRKQRPQSARASVRSPSLHSSSASAVSIYAGTSGSTKAKPKRPSSASVTSRGRSQSSISASATTTSASDSRRVQSGSSAPRGTSQAGFSKNTPRKLASWTTADVSLWLKSVNMECYGKLFRDSGISGRILQMLESADLGVLGIQRVHCERLMNHITQLRTAPLPSRGSLKQKAQLNSVIPSSPDTGNVGKDDTIVKIQSGINEAEVLVLDAAHAYIDGESGDSGDKIIQSPASRAANGAVGPGAHKQEISTHGATKLLSKFDVSMNSTRLVDEGHAETDRPVLSTVSKATPASVVLDMPIGGITTKKSASSNSGTVSKTGAAPMQQSESNTSSQRQQDLSNSQHDDVDDYDEVDDFIIDDDEEDSEDEGAGSGGEGEDLFEAAAAVASMRPSSSSRPRPPSARRRPSSAPARCREREDSLEKLRLGQADGGSQNVIRSNDTCKSSPSVTWEGAPATKRRGAGSNRPQSAPRNAPSVSAQHSSSSAQASSKKLSHKRPSSSRPWSDARASSSRKARPASATPAHRSRPATSVGISTFGVGVQPASRRRNVGEMQVSDGVLRGLITPNTEITLEVERCHNCWKHAMTTRHDESKYISHVDQLKTLVASDLSGCHVIERPDPNLPPSANLEATNGHRLGSFEVVARWRSGGSKYHCVLHSKLTKKKFPNLNKLVADLVAVLPIRHRVTVSVWNASSGTPCRGEQIVLHRGDESKAFVSAADTDDRGAASAMLPSGTFLVSLPNESTPDGQMKAFEVPVRVGNSAVCCTIAKVGKAPEGRLRLVLLMADGCNCENMKLHLVPAGESGGTQTESDEQMAEAAVTVDEQGNLAGDASGVVVECSRSCGRNAPISLLVSRPFLSGSFCVRVSGCSQSDLSMVAVADSARGVLFAYSPMSGVNNRGSDGEQPFGLCSIDDDGERAGIWALRD